MSMVMEYEYNENGSMEHITFTGLNGNEFTGNIKNALGLLKVENPAVAFASRVKTNEYDNMSDDEFDSIYKAVDFISCLWRYPDAQDENYKQREMNVLMLLANALETVSRQQAIINRMDTNRKGRNEMMDTWGKAKK